MSREARALLFVIFVLACLLLAFSIVALFLAPDNLPRLPDPAAQVEESLRASPNTVPET